MRVLNTNVKPKPEGSKFSWPGFRSGSVVKKVIAIMYYFMMVVIPIYRCITVLRVCEFGGIGDVCLFIIAELMIVAVFAAPVLALGFSEHYDLHGIKLFLTVLVSWCVLITAVQWVGTLFSTTFIQSTNPPAVSENQDEEVNDSDAADDSEGKKSKKDKNQDDKKSDNNRGESDTDSDDEE